MTELEQLDTIAGPSNNELNEDQPENNTQITMQMTSHILMGLVEFQKEIHLQ